MNTGISKEQTNRMKELILILNKAAKAYYVDGAEIMSNYEYDALYDELKSIETACGLQLSNSPTANVGYEVLSSLPKERHSSPMLSLDKTKDPEALADFLGDKAGVLSWKMDGLTIVLTYDDGSLKKAVTRGNGEVGEIVTANAAHFKNLPLSIGFKGHLEVRGEAVIKYSDFNRINEEIPELEAKYKNPRNLCSGSVRQLNSRITAERNVMFFAFALVDCSTSDGIQAPSFKYVNEEFDWLASMGFTVVGHKLTDKNSIISDVEVFERKISKNDFPSDGLVLTFNDIEYGKSLGSTAKFPRNSIAFKWKDETAETILKGIEWSASRTGLINPVAVFDPVELEGTRVSRASLHNVTYIRDMKLGIGDRIEVYKANMIIPQIARDITASGNIVLPEVCPVCGEKIKDVKEAEVETMRCVNEACPAKKIKKFAHFASRDALNIEGLSEKTLDKLIQNHCLKEIIDIYRLSKFEEIITDMDGFGNKSYNKLIDAVEKSRTTELFHLIYGLGIPKIGLVNAKLICSGINKPEEIAELTADNLEAIKGIGPELAVNFTTYFANEKNKEEYLNLLKEFNLVETKRKQSNVLSGETFVITGKLSFFSARSELKEKIENLGGKVSDSVSKNTTFLINNNLNSSSGKNKKAKELGVKIISEEDFLKRIDELKIKK